MRSGSIVALAAISTLAMGASAANAATFLLTFAAPQGTNTGGPITLDATPDGVDFGVQQYLVDSASGFIDGNAVTLLAPGGFFNDNLIYYPSSPEIDYDGISFLAGGRDYNVFFGGVYAEVSEGISGPLDSFSLTEVVPEPATWALMLAGFAGLGAALRSRLFRRASSGPA